MVTVTKAGERATMDVRRARGAHHKRLQAMKAAMKAAKTERPDEFRKAEALMEKAVGKGNEEVKKTMDAAKRALQS